MQFSNLHFEHGLFDLLIVTFQGKTLFWPSMFPKALILGQKKFDLDRSLQVGQINHAKNANLKSAFLCGGLFF